MAYYHDAVTNSFSTSLLNELNHKVSPGMTKTVKCHLRTAETAVRSKASVNVCWMGG